MGTQKGGPQRRLQQISHKCPRFPDSSDLSSGSHSLTPHCARPGGRRDRHMATDRAGDLRVDTRGSIKRMGGDSRPADPSGHFRTFGHMSSDTSDTSNTCPRTLAGHWPDTPGDTGHHFGQTRCRCRCAGGGRTSVQRCLRTLGHSFVQLPTHLDAKHMYIVSDRHPQSACQHMTQEMLHGLAHKQRCTS